MSALPALRTGQVLAYGVLGLPLAFAALPLYVYVPRLYAGNLGLSLSVVGAILLGARIFDAVTDPVFGWIGDRSGRRGPWMALAMPALALGMLGLLAPPASAGPAWLLVLLVVACAGYSMVSVNYHAWGAELASGPAERTRVMASREGFGLLGVVLAAALPTVLGHDEATGLARMAWGFLPLLALAAAVTLTGAPMTSGRGRGVPLAAMGRVLRRRDFIRLLVLFGLGGMAAAVPASTVLFFIDDVIGRPQAAGPLLAVYFMAGAAGLPLWVRLADRLGKVAAWMTSMGLSIAVFAWAFTLGAGDVVAFGVICVLSGMALGADLALPPAILADQIGAGGAGAGACFGWWNLVAKVSLALAAGLALPLLDGLGYAPGADGDSARRALAGVYALVPVTLKCLALALTWRWRHRLGALR
ncbi:MFS transporter [Nitrogeniibacter mangrovi]|uniref:MFS transporter n=1 Tax=Nitrogeniibacter mangrovi TaxID=2016596 RepID=A0A6C1B266_9RHOO|nr:MFS transporter [Nitrogeniibacter mangrovi]QID17079.1 MFS transporter [Nitrogeniibacter mangrovi]